MKNYGLTNPINGISNRKIFNRFANDVYSLEDFENEYHPSFTNVASISGEIFTLSSLSFHQYTITNADTTLKAGEDNQISIKVPENTLIVCKKIENTPVTKRSEILDKYIIQEGALPSIYRLQKAPSWNGSNMVYTLYFSDREESSKTVNFGSLFSNVPGYIVSGASSSGKFNTGVVTDSTSIVTKTSGGDKQWDGLFPLYLQTVTSSSYYEVTGDIQYTVLTTDFSKAPVLNVSNSNINSRVVLR